MAEIMQPLSQPPAMLSTRTSSVDSFHHTQRQPPSPRSSYTPSTPPFRPTTTPPVQPYAFQTTPQLRQEHRATSVPAAQVTTPATTSAGSSSDKSTLSSSPASSISGSKSTSKEDPASPTRVIALSSSVPDLSLHNFDSSPKPSPDRYRRSSSNKKPEAAPSGSGMAAVEHLYIPPPSRSPVSDDLQVSKAESAKRYRRRSMADPDSPSKPSLGQRPNSSHGAMSPGGETIRPVYSHQRHSSGESARSDTSTKEVGIRQPSQSPRKDASPVRSAADPNRRLPAPSPLSRSALPSDGSPDRHQSQSSPSKQQSPAVQQLAALSDKDLNKGMKSRLRRAFSFGSAAELRKAALTRPAGENVAPRGGDSMDDLDDEQREIIRRQEAAGIGAGIYSGQGGFSGSTDNLSISSTASSASVMLRKMGQGMKKGGRSLKGLFRPKSIVGVPAADGPVQPSLAEVSMVTVEAERQRFSVVSEDGFPSPDRKRESADVTHVRSDSSDRKDSLRKSIIGGDQERADALAAVKKGILKRSTTGSPHGSPIIRAQSPVIRAQPSPVMRAQAATWAGGPTIAIPVDSTPSSPKGDNKPRSVSSAHSASNDYFTRGMVVGTRSMPQTPLGSRNISFSPRIQFHDVWSSTEYDRRCEIATCNRLTPILAQQIKEELNTFKMEMEVHELSKPHTHFF